MIMTIGSWPIVPILACFLVACQSASAPPPLESGAGASADDANSGPSDCPDGAAMGSPNGAACSGGHGCVFTPPPACTQGAQYYMDPGIYTCDCSSQLVWTCTQEGGGSALFPCIGTAGSGDN